MVWSTRRCMSTQHGTVTANYGPSEDISTVLLPPWIGDIQVVARTDGRNILTVEFTRRWEQEQWLALPIAETPSNLGMLCLLGGGRRLCEDSAVRARILVPPKRVGSVKALPLDPDKG
ncbi:MAG TPA: hypothetical protein VFZ48_03340 [Candidatus Saccharimonadales bacterium]